MVKRACGPHVADKMAARRDVQGRLYYGLAAWDAPLVHCHMIPFYGNPECAYTPPRS